jgi:predicted DNA-binding transcriptional regulator YafY
MLRDGGVPIETEVLSGDRAGTTGYRIDRRRYELRLDLSAEETRAVQLAVAAVHLRPDWSADALLKLGAADETDRAETGPSAVLSSLPSQPVLFDASTRRATVRFRYSDRDRELDPYGLLTRDGFWYVVGFDHGHGEQRTFRVDRIQGDVASGPPDSFTVPSGFDLVHVLPDDPKAMGAAQDAFVAVEPIRAGKVAREVGDDAVMERRPDGGILVRVPCGNVPAFRSWLLGLLDDAVVVGPPEVRADVVAWLTGIAGARS